MRKLFDIVGCMAFPTAQAGLTTRHEPIKAPHFLVCSALCIVVARCSACGSQGAKSCIPLDKKGSDRFLPCFYRAKQLTPRLQGGYVVLQSSSARNVDLSRPKKEESQCPWKCFTRATSNPSDLGGLRNGKNQSRLKKRLCRKISSYHETPSRMHCIGCDNYAAVDNTSRLDNGKEAGRIFGEGAGPWQHRTVRDASQEWVRSQRKIGAHIYVWRSSGGQPPWQSHDFALHLSLRCRFFMFTSSSRCLKTQILAEGCLKKEQGRNLRRLALPRDFEADGIHQAESPAHKNRQYYTLFSCRKVVGRA